MPVGVRSSMRQSASLLVLLMAYSVESQSVFSGLDVDKNIDYLAHHHGLGYCRTIAERLESQFGDKSRGTCGRAEVLRGVSGSSPLDLLKTVGQRLLNEIPQHIP